jgi:hypothetical protein
MQPSLKWLNHSSVSAWVSPSFWTRCSISAPSVLSFWVKRERDEHVFQHFAIWQQQTHPAMMWGSKKSRMHMKVPSTTMLSSPTLSPLLTRGKNIVRYFLDRLRTFNIPHYFKYKMLIFHIFSHLKIKVHLEELFISLQTVHGVAWKEPNVNTFGVRHQATSSPPPTFDSQSIPNFESGHYLPFLLLRCVQISIRFYLWKSILHMILHSKEQSFLALKQ